MSAVASNISLAWNSQPEPTSPADPEPALNEDPDSEDNWQKRHYHDSEDHLSRVDYDAHRSSLIENENSPESQSLPELDRPSSQGFVSALDVSDSGSNGSKIFSERGTALLVPYHTSEGTSLPNSSARGSGWHGSRAIHSPSPTKPERVEYLEEKSIEIGRSNATSHTSTGREPMDENAYVMPISMHAPSLNRPSDSKAIALPHDLLPNGRMSQDDKFSSHLPPDSASAGNDGWAGPKEHVQGWTPSPQAVMESNGPNNSSLARKPSPPLQEDGWPAYKQITSAYIAPIERSSPVPVLASARPPVNQMSGGWQTPVNVVSSYNSSQSEIYAAPLNHNNTNGWSASSTSRSAVAAPFASNSSFVPVGNPHVMPYQSRPSEASNDGWPAPKTEIRGWNPDIVDYLSQDTDKARRPQPASMTGGASGWRVIGDGLPSSHKGAAPISSSQGGVENGPSNNRGSSGPFRSVPEPVGTEWRTSTPKASIPSLQRNSVESAPFNSQRQQQLSQPGPAVLAPTSSVSSRMRTRVISGWTVEVPASPSPPPPVPSTSLDKWKLPQTSDPDPRSMKQDDNNYQNNASNADNGARKDDWTNARQLGTAVNMSDAQQATGQYIDAAGDANRKEIAVGRREPTHLGADSRAAQTNQQDFHGLASRRLDVEDSIRPSESASNVGGYNNSSSWSQGRPNESPRDAWKPTVRPHLGQWKPYAGDTASDTSGSPNHTGSLNKVYDSSAEGNWRMATSENKTPRGAQAAFPAQTLHRDTSNVAYTNENVDNGWSTSTTTEPRLHSQNNSGWQRPGGGMQFSAPTPQRWDSVGGDLVQDLERAATPRADRSIATHAHQGVPDIAGRSISIMGASKYHAEGLQMKEIISKLQKQVKAYEDRSSVDVNSADSPTSELLSKSERSNKLLSDENAELKSQVVKMEAERAMLRTMLKPVLDLLGLHSAESLSGKFEKEGLPGKVDDPSLAVLPHTREATPPPPTAGWN